MGSYHSYFRREIFVGKFDTDHALLIRFHDVLRLASLFTHIHIFALLNKTGVDLHSFTHCDPRVDYRGIGTNDKCD